MRLSVLVLMMSAIALLVSSLKTQAAISLTQLDISGGRVACAVVDIDSDTGRVACWGRNYFPMFMDGSRQKAFVPRLLPSFNEPVTQVVAGEEHGCALLQNGTVQCWGNNQFGQLGLGHHTPAYAPVEVTLNGAVSKLYAGGLNTCAKLANNELYCWGENQFGQLGLGHRNSVDLPTLVPVNDVKDIALLRNHSCLVQNAGLLLCSGDNSTLQLGDQLESLYTSFTPTLTGVSQVDVSNRHTCAVKTDGTIVCFGAGEAGQLGHGAAPVSSAAVTVLNINNAVKVATSGFTSCALLATGGVSCWGGNGVLQLGQTGGSLAFPQVVPNIAAVTDIQAGDQEFCVQQASGATCWGRASNGLLGDGGNARPRILAAVDFSFTRGYNSFQNITLGLQWTFGLFNNGIMRAAGANNNTQLGMLHGNTVGEFIESPVVAPSQQILAGNDHTCSIKLNGAVECWGRNYAGQAGSGDYTDPIWTPVEVYPAGVVQKLQILQTATCALLNNGTVECWGSNARGQLADGGVLASSPTPISVAAITSATDLNCAKTSSFCCATLSNQTKKCWGYNNAGQLGIEPTQEFETTPLETNWGADATSVGMGFFHTCYADMLGDVYCFGGNFYGMLGDGSLINRTSPQKVALPAKALEVKSGTYHTCALLVDSRLFCWGDNFYNTIGVGNSRYVLKPAYVMSDVIDFDLGNVFSCALDADRTLWCWGNNDAANFGNGTVGTFPFPTPVNYKKL